MASALQESDNAQSLASRTSLADAAYGKLEQFLSPLQNRLVGDEGAQGGSIFNSEEMGTPLEDLEGNTPSERSIPRVVNLGRQEVKPMDLNGACIINRDSVSSSTVVRHRRQRFDHLLT